MSATKFWYVEYIPTIYYKQSFCYYLSCILHIFFYAYGACMWWMGRIEISVFHMDIQYEIVRMYVYWTHITSWRVNCYIGISNNCKSSWISYFHHNSFQVRYQIYLKIECFWLHLEINFSMHYCQLDTIIIDTIKRRSRCW